MKVLVRFESEQCCEIIQWASAQTKSDTLLAYIVIVVLPVSTIWWPNVTPRIQRSQAVRQAFRVYLKGPGRTADICWLSSDKI